jgi:hypothetical protein
MTGGFTRADQGDPHTLRQMAGGDWMVLYSPMTAYQGRDPLCAFAAIGQVAGDEPNLGGNFKLATFAAAQHYWGHTLVIIVKPPPPAPIPSTSTLAAVVSELETVIEWSIAAASRLGYFAALYKRITIAVATAVTNGVFQDGPKMELFDASFANRYFDALNGHFHPDDFPKPTRAWQKTFDAAERDDLIILQHMLAGVNAHIDLDLGITAQSIAPALKLPTLRADFNTINAVIASQVNGVVDDINQLSPDLADLYQILASHEIFLINQAVVAMRDSAWRFAIVLAVLPSFSWPLAIWLRDRKVAAQAELIYHPPGVIGLIQATVDEIAERESRDVVRNIEVLDEIASTPAPIQTTL